MECPWRNGLPSNGPVCPREGGMFPLEPYWKKNEDPLQCELHPYKAVCPIQNSVSQVPGDAMTHTENHGNSGYISSDPG